MTLRRSFLLAILISASLATLSAGIGNAQGRTTSDQKTKPQIQNPAKKDASPEPDAPLADIPPPYEPQTLKLAEIMGSIAFLSTLCATSDGKDQGAIWRSKALEFVNAEPMSPARKERFAGAYNRGFQSYGLVYRTCTNNARLSIERLMDDGAKLTREIASRFGS